MTFRTWLAEAVSRLSHSDSPKRDAEILLTFVTGRTRSYIIAFDETPLNGDEQQRLEALLVRREQGEPVAYITGVREFWSLPLEVSPATLIPRPDTECLVEAALELLPAASCDILDLGTGTGAIALALASERPDCHVTGADIQPDAVALAQRNAARLGLTNTTFKESRWFASLPIHQFAMIVSNPPYIDENDEHLVQGDVRFEPRSALVAPQNGLADLAEIAAQSAHYLTLGGWLIVEHGWRQGDAVRELFRENGFYRVETRRDYGGNDRVTLGQREEK